MQLSTTVPSVHSNVKPFIGFSLTDNVKEGALVVDGVFDEGPAAQVGVKIDHEVLKIAGISVEGIAHARELVAEHCRPGHITRFDMRREDGTTFVASVWVMTADVKFKGKPYYFDVSLHRIRESDRLKRTWKEEDLQS
ncbi:hypothetical protein AGDE_14517 [Angomonas deanei]|uniref:PDZ domain containing protein, putative n=1 Tax=Angomonas deanei TaxID=59799 RepID=A0A7G2CBK4_9TRYP|nr:hypothetical protein AGDE_14517 [Angomonas deanei]CAD2215422.1 PDZ domain containing protein, putative [Angomonas deanei]|eukprot:EPY20702.1 hypothetical protein AGDE_14517 [Angomonas deanei]